MTSDWEATTQLFMRRGLLLHWEIFFPPSDPLLQHSQPDCKHKLMNSKLHGHQPSAEQQLQQISYLPIHYWGYGKWFNGEEISYLAQFSILPLGIKFNFPPKLCSEKRKENRHRISVQRWISNSLERGWWRWPGTDWLECLPSLAASWLQPNVRALSHNGHPVFQDTPQTLINFFPGAELHICSASSPELFTSIQI